MDVILVDSAKAFDKVPHNRLLSQLRAQGIRGNVLNWVREWLANRKQRLVLNGVSSGWKEAWSGVPLRSMQGPILYLVFINNLDAMAHLFMVIKKIHR